MCLPLPTHDACVIFSVSTQWPEEDDDIPDFIPVFDDDWQPQDVMSESQPQSKPQSKSPSQPPLHAKLSQASLARSLALCRRPFGKSTSDKCENLTVCGKIVISMYMLHSFEMDRVIIHHDSGPVLGPESER